MGRCRTLPPLSAEVSAELARLYPSITRTARALSARYRVPLDDAHGIIDEAAVDIARRWRPDRGASLATFLGRHLFADACKTLGRQLCRANRYHAAAESLPDLCPAPPPPTLGLLADDVRAVLGRVEGAVGRRVYTILRLVYADGLSRAEVGGRVGLCDTRITQLCTEWRARLRADMPEVAELLDGRAVG